MLTAVVDRSERRVLCANCRAVSEPEADYKPDHMRLPSNHGRVSWRTEFPRAGFEFPTALVYAPAVNHV